MKTYRSNSIVHIKVMKPDGNSVRLSFDPLTGGGSQYNTSDENIQYGLEHHAGFNNMFYLEGVTVDEPVQDNATESDEPKVQSVSVSNLDDAKEYLVEKFGISRTKLRSKSQILSAAEENGVEFTGI